MPRGRLSGIDPGRDSRPQRTLPRLQQQRNSAPCTPTPSSCFSYTSHDHNLYAMASGFGVAIHASDGGRGLAGRAPTSDRRPMNCAGLFSSTPRALCEALLKPGQAPSKIQLQGELYLPCRIERGANRPSRSPVNSGRGRGKGRMIGEIEELGPNVKGLGFGELESLKQGKIHLL